MKHQFSLLSYGNPSAICWPDSLSPLFCKPSVQKYLNLFLGPAVYTGLLALPGPVPHCPVTAALWWVMIQSTPLSLPFPSVYMYDHLVSLHTHTHTHTQVYNIHFKHPHATVKINHTTSYIIQNPEAMHINFPVLLFMLVFYAFYFYIPINCTVRLHYFCFKVNYFRAITIQKKIFHICDDPSFHHVEFSFNLKAFLLIFFIEQLVIKAFDFCFSKKLFILS